MENLSLPANLETLSIKTQIPTVSGIEIVIEDFQIIDLEMFSIHIRGKMLSRYQGRPDMYLRLTRIFTPNDITTSSHKLRNVLESLFRRGREEVLFYIFPHGTIINEIKPDDNNIFYADLVADTMRDIYFKNKGNDFF